MRVVAAPRWLATAGLATTLVAEVAAVALSAGLEPAYDTWVYACYSAAAAGTGALVARRHPANAVGWVLLATGVVNALVGDLAQGYGLRAAERGWAHGPLLEWLTQWNWVLGGSLLGLTFLLFPDGHWPGRRWRIVPVTLLVGAALAGAGLALDADSGSAFADDRNPYAVPGLPTPALFAVGLALFGGSLLAAVVGLCRRLRRAEGVVRQQLKWFVYVNTLGVLVLVPSAALWDQVPAVRVASALALLAMPIGAGVAILRHRLFDIDVVVNRTLVYATLTVVLALSYVAVTVLLGASLGRGSAWVTAAATLAVALAFRPVRARVQDAVDRRFDRRRWDALHRTDDFLERLRSGAAEPEELVPLLRELVDPSVDLVGRGPEVRHDALADAQRALLGAVLERGALAVQMIGLRDELRRRLAEVEASRARIVEATDRERRRMERDLHDGAQQRLVSVGLALRHAQHQLGRDPAAVDHTLEQSVAELAATIAELRQLTHGLPPSELDSGLAPAFHELARRSPVPVAVSVPPERFERGLEAAAYFVGCEGLTNAVKHAGATRIGLSAVRRDGALVVEVDDDGAGGAEPEGGSGLRGLSDRVAALGGRLHVSSPPGEGTRLVAELPCGS
jgi:signal transduction histidine kinase